MDIKKCFVLQILANDSVVLDRYNPAKQQCILLQHRIYCRAICVLHTALASEWDWKCCTKVDKSSKERKDWITALNGGMRQRQDIKEHKVDRNSRKPLKSTLKGYNRGVTLKTGDLPMFTLIVGSW